MKSPIFGKSGGYRKLDSFTFASIIQMGTLRFCEKFLNRTNDPCGRLFDQMTQAARSGRANIIEGSERAATSKETEMKLTDVARASLGELRGDYEMWLLNLGQAPWKRASDDARIIAEIGIDRFELTDDTPHDSAIHLLAQKKKFDRWLESGDSATVANAMLILIRRAIGALNHQLDAQGEIFVEEGGFREKLTSVRVEARAEKEDAPVCPACGKPMRKRKSSRGEFWGCTGYPECKGTRPGDDEGKRT
ncbi:MAG: four helix bundle suffix domain-containing protein [Kiritimatiellaeota bacterium]|nr:four helix bundle suffix domain-containing protein [Kiritimatiellota bacterium]